VGVLVGIDTRAEIWVLRVVGCAGDRGLPYYSILSFTLLDKKSGDVCSFHFETACLLAKAFTRHSFGT